MTAERATVVTPIDSWHEPEYPISRCPAARACRADPIKLVARIRQPPTIKGLKGCFVNSFIEIAILLVSLAFFILINIADSRPF